jgi:hypothetical protein
VETKHLLKVVGEAAGAGKDENYVVQDAHTVVAFTKQAGHEIFGITPLSVASAVAQIKRNHAHVEANNANLSDDDVVPNSNLVSTGMELINKIDEVLKIRAVDDVFTEAATTRCMGAFHFLSESLVHSRNTLQKIEKRCDQDRLVLGSLTEVREKGLADARTLKENLV